MAEDGSARIERGLDGPLEVAFADDARLRVDHAVFAYPPAAVHTRRQWTLELEVEALRRESLLALFEAGVSPLGPPQLLQFEIRGTIVLSYEPTEWLAARLDIIEDEAGLVSSGVIDARVAGDALDLRNYEFSSAVQNPT